MNVCKPQTQRLRKEYNKTEVSLGNIRLILSKAKQKLSKLKFNLAVTATKNKSNIKFEVRVHFLLYLIYSLISIYFTWGNLIQTYMKHDHIQLFLPSYKYTILPNMLPPNFMPFLFGNPLNKSS